MKVVIAGGTGQIGAMLRRSLRARSAEVVVLSRQAQFPEQVAWDGASVGPWAQQLDGADVVINLAGRSVNCRYSERNLAEMLSSRVRSTEAIGQAIAQAAKPPRVWLQMSTATIYAHRYDAPNDEASGLLGGSEPNVPSYWGRSIVIAQAWEGALAAAKVPHTRKVALRAAMVMSPDQGGIFDVLLRLVRWGAGGAVDGGQQFVSWIHEHDFVRAIDFLIAREAVHGPVNLAAPAPLAQRAFMSALADAWGRRLAMPASKWMVEVGAFLMQTDTELILKSRRVVPRRLEEAGFTFAFPTWPEAARELVARYREHADRACA